MQIKKTNHTGICDISNIKTTVKQSWHHGGKENFHHGFHYTYLVQ